MILCLEPIKPNETDVLLNWRDRYSDNIFGPHQLPDGALRAMVLITLLLQPWEDLPSLIIIDEPELGLHPSAITIIAALLKQASLHSQVIVATQSPTLLDEFDPEDVIVVDRKEGKSIFTRLDSDKAAGMAGRILARRDLAEKRHRRRTVLMARLHLIVEGQTEQAFAAQLLIPHLAKNGVYLSMPQLAAHARRKGKTHRGGILSYAPFKNDILRRLKADQSSDVFLSTMIDLNGLPSDFPGVQSSASELILTAVLSSSKLH